MMRERRQEISAALLGIIVALVLWLTIFGRESQGRVSFYMPFRTITAFWKSIQRGGIGGNFLGNILLFIPIGALLPIVTGWKKLWKVAGVGFGFSLLIETTQIITLRGCFDPDDIILNSLGCIIGYGLLTVAQKVIHRAE